MFGVYASCVSIKAERLANMYPFFFALFFYYLSQVIAILNSVIAHRTFSSYRAALVSTLILFDIIQQYCNVMTVVRWVNMTAVCCLFCIICILGFLVINEVCTLC